MIYDKEIPVSMYWGGLTESQLAAFQTRQQGNTCGLHACAAALRLLIGVELDANQEALELRSSGLKSLLYLAPFHLGMYPFQQAAWLNAMARKHGYPIKARVELGRLNSLWILLANHPECCVIMDLAWVWSPPGIHYGKNAKPAKLYPRLLTAHAMLLAAFDKGHLDDAGVKRPWGFINSWHVGGREGSKASSLYWMSHADFQRSWRFAWQRMVLVKRNVDYSHLYVN